MSGTLCPTCGYNLPNYPPRGKRYALIGSILGFSDKESHAAALEKYCGLSHEHAMAAVQQSMDYASRILLRRDLTDSAVHYIASRLDRGRFDLRIVEDEGEENDDALLMKESAMELPVPAQPKDSGIGFWGVVGAVVVALLILSFL